MFSIPMNEMTIPQVTIPLDYDKVYINFNGVRLRPVDYIKYLGMYTVKHLNWNFLSKQLREANGILSKLQ